MKVVNIGVYAIFIISLVSSQFPRQLPEVPEFFPNGSFIFTNTTGTLHKPTLYVPVFSLLEITFYLGWLKVAQSLLNPFGDDDEDFDLLPLMERNLAISLWMVDLRHGMPAQASKTHPEEEAPMTSAQKRLSFAKPTDTLFFRQLGPISAVNDDPLSELLASAAQLDVPETLTPAGPTDDSDQAPQLGSAAIVFERKESRRMSMGVGDSIRRKQSSIAVIMNHMRRKNARAQSPNITGASRQSSVASVATHHTSQTGVDDDLEAHLT